MGDLRAGDCRFRRSAAGVFGMARGCADQPYRPVVVVDDVADAAAAGHFVLPWLHIAAVVPAGGQVAAEPVLAVVPCPRLRASVFRSYSDVHRHRVALE